MKIYKDVISSIKETKTLSTHMTKLGKIRATTEDDKLITLLSPVINNLR